MSQKNYDIKIAQELMKSDNHIRGLARAIGTNQTTISRTINRLYEANLVDFRMQGKNKVFFLKKNLEARQYAYLCEIEKLISTIRNYPMLRRIIEEIQKKDVPLAILFGSYAKGTATKDSDIDVYIDSTDRKVKEEIIQIDSRISVKQGKYNPQNLLIKEIDKNHVILKGVEGYYAQHRLFS